MSSNKENLYVCKNSECKKKVPVSQMTIHECESKSGKMMKERYCCKECFDKVMTARVDKEQMNKCYDYMRYQILQYPKGRMLSNHMRSRLISLTQGKFVHRGKTVDKVYTYEQIYNTLVICRINIHQGMATTDFKDDLHLGNYIFSIIINNINDVVTRMERKTKAEERLDNAKVVVGEYQYIKKENNKVANKLKDLF